MNQDLSNDGVELRLDPELT
jgi:hypothetical protein